MKLILSENGVCGKSGGGLRRNGLPGRAACVLLFAVAMIAFAPPAVALGPSGLVSPDHIIPGSGDSFYVAHMPLSCGGWEIVHYFGDGTRDPDFHCASPDSCDTGAGRAGLSGNASRGGAFEGRVRGQAMDGETNSLYLLQDDGIHPYYADTGDSAGTKIDLPTAGQGFAQPPRSMSFNGSGVYRRFFVVDADGVVWKKMIGAISWDKYSNASPASPDKFRDASVKTITSTSPHSQTEKNFPNRGRVLRKLRKSSSPVLRRRETAHTRTTMSAGSGKRYDTTCAGCSVLSG